jgi:hypothetical protein
MAQYDFFDPSGRGTGMKGGIEASNKLFDGIEQRKINAMKMMGVEDSQRRNAMTEDVKTAEVLLKNKDTKGAMEFLSDRAQASSQSGGNPRETMEVYNTIRDGNVPEALEMLANYRSVFDDSYKPLKPKAQDSRQKAEGGMVFNPNDGTYSVDPVAKQRLDQIAAKKASGATLDLKDKQSINKDITGFLKDTTLIYDTAKALGGLQKIPSGPAALAVVFKFMKALDPTSVVREGEQASAEQSAGVPAAVRNFYNKLASGEKLGTEQIQQFVDTAQGLSNSAINSSNEQITSYLNTYGDSLPARFSKSIMGRIPKSFEERSPKKTGGQVMTDASGNKATVYPDGTFEELP